jgi:hypothetical protein
LKAEKLRQLELISASEGEVRRCDDELGDIRENQLRLKREMDGLRDELFKREEEEAIVMDNSHVVTDGSTPSGDSEGKRMRLDRQKQLRSVT